MTCVMGVLALLAGCATNQPRELVSLPEKFNTPDGMRENPATGDVIISCPNFNDARYPAVLLRLTKDNQVEEFFRLPLHPGTGRAGPMGLDFGPDGNLYVADNQYFFDKHGASRLLRINIKGGKAVSADVVAEGFNLANAVMWKGDQLYVSDTFFDLPGQPGYSGIYRFSLMELSVGKVKLKGKNQAEPHLLARFQTGPNARNDLAGADGITFDSAGNLYTGNFGDGAMFKVTFNADGSVKSSSVFVKDPRLTCIDGLFCDLKTGIIYVADSERNAVQKVSPDGKVQTLWENPDTDGRGGLLDQPCEVLMRGDELIISNMDFPVPGMRNQKYDSVRNMSVIMLKN